MAVGDPDVTTNGLQAYSKGTGAVLSNCEADAIDVRTLEPNQFAIRWRIAGTANVPFPGLRIKPYIAPQLCGFKKFKELFLKVTSTFTVNSDGLVDSETAPWLHLEWAMEPRTRSRFPPGTCSCLLWRPGYPA